MKYRTRVHRFGDRAKNLSCEATTESAAREGYCDLKESLAARRGGSIALFEAYKKEPLLAERVGTPPALPLRKKPPRRTSQSKRNRK
jgi:hypothetical protein